MMTKARDVDVMLDLTTSYITSRCIQVVAELSIADKIGDTPRGAEALANECGVRSDPLRRVLRLLASRGVFAEEGVDSFGHTDLSRTLRTDHPRSMRGWAQMTGGPIFEAFADLKHSLKTGDPAFPVVHGCAPYQYFATHPDDRRAFAGAMGDWNRQLAASVLAVRQLANARLIVDVGGSFGYLLSDLLARCPHSQGIVFDLPAIADGARQRIESLGIDERCRVVGGDFFESVPAGGDVYLMSWILHNWSDADCVRILRNCRRAMAPSARLLTIDHVIARDNAYDFGRTSDLAMLVAFGGRERTEEEFRDVLQEGGFRLVSVSALSVPVSLLESVPLPTS
jgi:hypothetical protein